ncbi:MAG: shikimate dehydrogenase [Gammaproteobacteria bacterium]|nr:shikimate dehydrogenase [Gammaproteobacteria bacterium]
MSQYAVVGNPVKHSKSPRIHSLFASQTGMELAYTAIQLKPENFEAGVRKFFADGGAGLNVTVPFKEKAFLLADSCSERARLAQAVNTLCVDGDGALIGDNTDGVGLVRDIKGNHQFEIRQRRILLLGAGGAVRGALSALVAEDPAEITIANRTPGKALQLKAEFGHLADLTAVGFGELDATAFDLVINGTSLGLEGKLPPISKAVISSACCCYDMVYADSDTVFVRWARDNGAVLALDGLGMLVEQAAESFAIWHGLRPQTLSVISQLR